MLGHVKSHRAYSLNANASSECPRSGCSMLFIFTIPSHIIRLVIDFFRNSFPKPRDRLSLTKFTPKAQARRAVWPFDKMAPSELVAEFPAMKPQFIVSFKSYKDAEKTWVEPIENPSLRNRSNRRCRYISGNRLSQNIIISEEASAFDAA